MIGLGDCTVDRNVDNPDVVQIFVVIDPLKTGNDIGGIAHPIFVGHLDADQLRFGRDADVLAIGCRAIASDDASDMGAVAILIAIIHVRAEVDRGDEPQVAVLFKIFVIVNPTIDDRDHNIVTIARWCFVPDLRTARHFGKGIGQILNTDTVGTDYITGQF